MTRILTQEETDKLVREGKIRHREKIIVVHGEAARGEDMKAARKFIEELDKTGTKLSFDIEGIEVYEPEPYSEKEMQQRRYDKYERERQARQAQIKAEQACKQNKKIKDKRKKQMIKNSKRRNRK